jgi:hypothetical protein
MALEEVDHLVAMTRDDLVLAQFQDGVRRLLSEGGAAKHDGRAKGGGNEGLHRAKSMIQLTSQVAPSSGEKAWVHCALPGTSGS